MAYWTKIDGKIEKHDGRSPMLGAMIAIRFATSMSGVKVEDCAIYKRDPVKHPDEPDILAAKLEKARTSELARQIRGIMKGKRP